MTIYLDCNATTPIDPEVMKVVRHYMEVEFGNAGSRTHEFGLRAKQAVERAREQVGSVVDAKPDEVIFTSGATEANNLAILGLEAEGRRTGKMHIVSTQIEHKAVLEPLAELERRGFEVTLLPPNKGGWVEAARVRDSVRANTLLVTVMHVNNETGIIQDIEGIADALADSMAFFHVDAAQGFGKVDGLSRPRIDLISASGHKIHAPKGVGALVARRRKWNRVPLTPLMFGGGQEHGLRPGTQPVALIAGFGAAAVRARARYESLVSDEARVFRETLREELMGLGLAPLGDQDRGLRSTLAMSLPTVDSEAALLALKSEFAVSNGAACSSSEYRDSHVVAAMGVFGRGFLRFSWDRAHSPDLARKIAALLGALGSWSG
jgi:cysteine desulfurase